LFAEEQEYLQPLFGVAPSNIDDEITDDRENDRVCRLDNETRFN